ncbi:hypothetical protein F5Y06DRAFT_278355 [Hypoxylon sp. FL0890]|nr:hypothetical protein F5Y06DRAFT_278355 [Hypoxylon sp. FL0890]
MLQVEELTSVIMMRQQEGFRLLGIVNVTSFPVPSLTLSTARCRFDPNYFTTFTAANLAEIQEGDLSFVSNPEITNISIS